MKNNMGSSDRLIRPTIAIVILALFFTGIIQGILGVVLMALAAIFIVTAILGYCPLYSLLGVNTCTS